MTSNQSMVEMMDSQKAAEKMEELQKQKNEMVKLVQTMADTLGYKLVRKYDPEECYDSYVDMVYVNSVLEDIKHNKSWMYQMNVGIPTLTRSTVSDLSKFTKDATDPVVTKAIENSIVKMVTKIQLALGKYIENKIKEKAE